MSFRLSGKKAKSSGKTLVKEDGKEHLREWVRIEVVFFFFFFARQGQGKSQMGDEEKEHE